MAGKYKPRNNPRPMLLSDRILLILQSGGPRSHEALALIFSTTVGSIRTSNSFNRSMGFIEPIGKSMNRAAGPVRFSITPDGVKRIEERIKDKA